VQQLHLVGFTTELDGLIFSARKGSKSGGYVARLDDRLLSVVRDAIRFHTGEDLLDAADGDAAGESRRRSRRLAHQDSHLSPKEIQARLRAGRTVADVAVEAGVDEEWIMRFATPVLAEQSQVVERALLVPCRTSRKGASGQTLAVSVGWNLADRGLRVTAGEMAGGWSAYHVREGSWVVAFRYVSRGREQVARWEFDLPTGDLVSINRLASELGYVEPGRRRRQPSISEVIADDAAQPRPSPPVKAPVPPPPPDPEPPPPRPAKKAAKKKVVKKRPATKRAAPQKAAPRKAAPKKAAPKRAAAKKVAKKVAKRVAPRATKKATSRVIKKAAPVVKRARTRPTKKAAPRARRPAKVAPRPLRVRKLPAVIEPSVYAGALGVVPTVGNGSTHDVAAEPVEILAPGIPSPARQRPLVAVRRIDTRTRRFPPPPAQRIVRPQPAEPDDDRPAVVIQARRADS